MSANTNVPISQQSEEAENVGSNDSANPTMGDIIAERLSRRDLMKGILAVTAIGATVTPLALEAGRAQAQTAGNTTPHFNFNEVAAGVDEKHHVAEGYDADVLIRWGDAVLPGAPAFDPPKQTAAAQAQAVRLQQRLPRLHPARRRGRARPAGGQSRVHQRGTDVPGPRPAGRRIGRVRQSDQGAWPRSR